MINFQNLTDEQILKEFVNRFECDGAILIYKDGGYETGLAEWKNSAGKNWIRSVIKTIENNQQVILTS